MPVNAPRRLLESEQIGDVMVVRFCIATVREDQDIMEIFGQLDQVVADGCYKLVLSFTGVKSIASYAIGRLVGLNQRMKDREGKLVLCDLTPVVDEIIDLMKLNRKMAIRKSEQDALEAF